MDKAPSQADIFELEINKDFAKYEALYKLYIPPILLDKL